MDKCCPNCDKFFQSDRYSFCSVKCHTHFTGGYEPIRSQWRVLRYWLEERSKQRMPYLFAREYDEDLSYEFYRLVQRDI